MPFRSELVCVGSNQENLSLRRLEGNQKLCRHGGLVESSAESGRVHKIVRMFLQLRPVNQTQSLLMSCRCKVFVKGCAKADYRQADSKHSHRITNLVATVEYTGRPQFLYERSFAESIRVKASCPKEVGRQQYSSAHGPQQSRRL